MSSDGRTLARQLLWLAFNRYRFLLDFGERIRPEFFGSSEERYLIKHALSYFDINGRVMSKSALMHQVEADEEDEQLKVENVSTKAIWRLYDSMITVPNAELDYFWKTVDEFCRRQGWGLALREASSLLNTEGVDASIEILDVARRNLDPSTARSAEVFGKTWEILNRVAQRESADTYATTGLPMLDRIMGGGVQAGELAVFIARTGGGKTMWLCYVASKAFMNGMDVIYYTLEIDRDDIGLRVLSSNSGVDINDYIAMEAGRGDADAGQKGKVTPQDKIRKMNRAIKLVQDGGKHDVYVRDIPPRKSDINTIVADIAKVRRQGVNPGLVIVDYADRLKPRGRHEKRIDAEYEVFADLASVAKEEHVAIWTAAQANRQALGKRVINLREIAGAFSKAWDATFVIAAGQNDQMMRDGEFNFHLAKTRRRGRLDRSHRDQLPVLYDFSKSQFFDAVNPWEMEDDEGIALSRPAVDHGDDPALVEDGHDG